MKPIITISPAMQNLTRKAPLSAAGVAPSGSGLECVVRGASSRPSWRNGAGEDALPTGAGRLVAEGSAPSRAAQAVQKRAVARFPSPHSGQTIIPDLALGIALHFA